MGFDFGGVLRQAGEYLRRHLKSKAVSRPRSGGPSVSRPKRLTGFETHGRFLETRYKDQKLPSSQVE